jgi:PAS domain S-box-containing protein
LDDIPIIMADATGLIRYWSAGCVEAFGHSERAAIGQSLDLVVPPQFREAHWAGFRRAMISGQADAENKPGSFPAMNARGEAVTISGTLTLLRRSDGTAMGAMVIFG